MFVYLIKTKDKNQYKVGITSNLVRWLWQLQNGTPNQLMVESLRRASDRQEARKLEKQIHEYLKTIHAHIRGEWFDIHPADLIKVKGLFFDLY